MPQAVRPLGVAHEERGPLARRKHWYGRRRSRGPVALVALAGLVASVSAVFAIGLGTDADAPLAGAPAAASAARAQPAPPRPPGLMSVGPVGGRPVEMPPNEPSPDPAPLPPVFARVEALELHLPATRAVLVGFHEAATRRPAAMAPVGALLDHQNTTKFEPPPDEEGVGYVVLSSRGRPMPATSAADIVLTDDVAVLAPVTGTVTDVRTYYLSGRYLDHRVEVAPSDAPHLRVVLIHVEAPTVMRGDRVLAGQSVLAPRVRTFPFPSHIDRYTEPDRFGHVHLEVHATTTEPDGSD